MLFCFDKFCYKLAKLCDVAVLVKWRKPNGIYPYLGFPFAITNHLGDALFRGIAVRRISDTDRTSPTTWVHCSSPPHKIYEKF